MEDSPLLLDLYELTMAQAYLRYRKNSLATFDLFVRQLPKGRSYLVSAGLKDILGYIKELSFSSSDLAYLKGKKIFSTEFLKYLANFKFGGDIWAVPEGRIVFANEPLIRVTAPIIEAQIVESFFLNTINLQTMIASKASRVVNAAKDREVFDFSLRRTHGAQAGLKVARSSYIAGFNGTATVLAGKLYHMPVVGTMAHSFIMSFKHELDAFLAYALTFPSRTVLLVDTYNTRQGILNAITGGLYLKKKGYKLQGIRLDSGDIVSLSKLARRLLDNTGLGFVKIFASGNLDEFKIKRLLRQGARVDSFGVGTNMGTSIDAPSLDVIYKIVEVTDEEGNFLPTMKLSKAKITYPGRKQVFRIEDKNGRFIKDILGLEKEKISGLRLLKKVVDKGRIVYKSPTLDKVRLALKSELCRFPQGLLDIDSDYMYQVLVSPALKRLQKSLARQLRERQ
ncbi:MAG: nicotinate phosphoribosyltransferase [Candidatus Omnitrophica bacterium]|nr:nicotinate phosphoribosyltransferase [Candidatus Omnitrophota bacterium]